MKTIGGYLLVCIGFGMCCTPIIPTGPHDVGWFIRNPAMRNSAVYACHGRNVMDDCRSAQVAERMIRHAGLDSNATSLSGD